MARGFKTDSGKKAGEFYTPQPVAKLMTQIAFRREDEQGFTIYDATINQIALLNAKKFFSPASKPSTLVRSFNTLPQPGSDEHDPTRGSGGKPVLA